MSKLLTSILLILASNTYAANFNINIIGPKYKNNIVFQDEPTTKTVGYFDLVTSTQMLTATVTRPDDSNENLFKIDVYTREGALLSTTSEIKIDEQKTFNIDTPKLKTKTQVLISRKN